MQASAFRSADLWVSCRSSGHLPPLLQPFPLLPDVEVMVPLFLGPGPGPGFRSELLLSQSAALGLSLELSETWS